MTVRFDPASVRAFMARDWGMMRELKRQYWRERLDRGGLVEALRVTQQMREQGLAINPSWPSQQERDADLETHRRVAKALLATATKARANEKTRPGPDGTRGVRAVRRRT